MYKDHTVSVVVPAYNEEDSVGEVIRTVPEFVDRVYVVDDGSTDDTWSEIQRHAAAVNEAHDGELDRHIVPIQHEQNRGVGGAIKTGYQQSLADGIDIATVMAGDAQMDPALLERYIDPIAEGLADYTKGNRFLHEDIEEMPRFRRFGNQVLSTLTKISSGYWGISDSQNGYAAISREALEAIELDELYEFYGYCNDLLVKLNVAGMRVMDIPHSSDYLYDEDWDSHISLDSYVPRVSFMLLRNFGWRLRKKYLTPPHPMALLYGVGAALGVVGVLGTLAAVATRDGGETGLVSLVFGVVLFLTGAALDRELEPDLEQQGETPGDGH
ncbi:glycosyltransferase family 2 protein [Halorarius litoreus]|uniref:glycosyltransferase family 2 protein n=1 Tax=Halorarius litoreus TaxID=2962676 RepID=UPI0020CC596F|nr:glycosyltransferase family 2 protein [Halorarius litoreus]